MELFQANNQWSSRPPDQRFESLVDLFKATKRYADTSAERPDVPYSTLRAEANKGEVVLVGKGNQPATFTHWSFGQLSNRLEAPPNFLRELPATLAVQVLNHRLKEKGDELKTANLLFHKNGGFLLRSITSDKYFRIWNYEVAERLVGAKEFGWRVPPAMPAKAGQPGTRKATKADLLDTSLIREGMLIAPAGLYASDHDMFVFLVNDSNRIKDGSPEGLGRGLFITNSEVGAASLSVTKFLYRYICYNHIVWDAKDVKKISIRHIGKAGLRMQYQFEGILEEYANESASDQEAKIQNARKMTLGTTKEEVLDFLFGKRMLTYKAAKQAYEAVVPDVDGKPETVYGMVQGITRISQDTPYADERVALDAAAAKVLALAF